MEGFTYQLPCQIIYGEEASHDLAAALQTIKSVQTAVVVTDHTLYTLGILDKLLAHMKAAGIHVSVYAETKSNPTANNIDEVAYLIRDHKAEAVIGVGGGSSIDVAKTAALVANGNKSAADYALGRQPFPYRDIVSAAIPTTAGTGAEVTSTVIYSDADNRKLWAWDKRMAPDIAVLDPSLTVDLPASLTAATGIDAMVHAIEACTGKARNPLIEAYSLQAIRLVRMYLPLVLEEPNHVEARGQLLIAAMLGGAAIEGGATGIAHNIGHALSTTAGLHHGKAVALAMYHTYHWNVEQAEDKAYTFAEIAKALGVKEDGRSEKELARAGADQFQHVVEQLPVPMQADEAGLANISASEIISACLAEENQPMRTNNCAWMNEATLTKVINKMLQQS
ncbi:iron-containing alcohol dehydrogenase [Salsuginibacillus kocurii]|uniref:iron-containing alcohol dehydrogenase n=1 Tax=Salsuginibacillus kocurii TaxID=427078 RepID=UPI000362C3F2|nr:iron-containing alcohol dehydrogenase [Salsuginibacillus kocurii]